MEQIFSGYCRVMDHARTVMAESDGVQWEFDCDFPSCPFAGECPIGKQLAGLQQRRYK